MNTKHMHEQISAEFMMSVIHSSDPKDVTIIGEKNSISYQTWKRYLGTLTLRASPSQDLDDPCKGDTGLVHADALLCNTDNPSDPP